MRLVAPVVAVPPHHLHQPPRRPPKHSLGGVSSSSSSHGGCNCGKTQRSQRSHHTHSTISCTVRKELASYENPHQQPPPPVTVRPAKRNASTESLDLLNRSPPECSCAVYSPNSIDGSKCRKCSQSRQALTTSGQRAQKKYNSSKYKDASTSPKSNSPLRVVSTEPKSPRSPKSPRAEASTDTKFDFPCSPRTESHYKRLSTLSINAGQKNVGTSPRKQPVSPNKLTPVKSDRVLEKSNSLGESKPQKQLRTTRSLSPRPPVKHQHSIMVSDENDIVSVKLSPNEEFDETKEKAKDEDGKTAVKKKAQSEANSPNLSDCGSLKLDDTSLKNANNRSTSCLVYVPSDPWTRMSAIPSPIPTKKQQDHHQKAKKLASKSFSKPNLEYFEDSDPWVYRSNIVLSEQAVKKKGSLPHQTKSLSSALSRDGGFDNARAQRLCHQRSLTKFDKNLTIPGIDLHFDARKKITRPKLQRSKSPAFYEELFQPEKGTTPNKSLNKNKSVSSLKIEKNASNSNINNGAKCTCHEGNSLGRPSNHNTKCCENVYKSSTSITSPTIKKQQSSPKLCIPQSPPTNANQPELVKASLTVLNPNLLQPRHSFSTTPTQKDDELQLNIRRLSEQMNKYHHHTGGGGSAGTGYFSQKKQAPSFMNDTIPAPPLTKSKKSSSGGAAGGSGGLLVSSGSSNALLIEPGQKQRASSHSKINDPLMETRC
ncbi:uncharacterized protein LOC119766347 [Culex quinquefasciatus]|uniref:uncharacterized protein LOC119766347 n=1 Tax=Culex quinquefasciatus TaxID=7176 RepID=UPI0018E2C6BA|nr:uncharacterized protein LOC119766347 [Culex quinquefasciatus]